MLETYNILISIIVLYIRQIGIYLYSYSFNPICIDSCEGSRYLSTINFKMDGDVKITKRESDIYDFFYDFTTN